VKGRSDVINRTAMAIVLLFAVGAQAQDKTVQLKTIQLGAACASAQSCPAGLG
jgi:hypothetical protein